MTEFDRVHALTVRMMASLRVNIPHKADSFDRTLTHDVAAYVCTTAGIDVPVHAEPASSHPWATLKRVVKGNGKHDAK